MNYDNLVKKVLLNMKYDSKKTLSENKHLLTESGSVTWTVDRTYELEAFGFNDYINKGSVIRSIEGYSICEYGNCISIKCPGPDCSAQYNGGPWKGSKEVFTFVCSNIRNKLGYSAMYQSGISIINGKYENDQLQAKLESVFCTPRVKTVDDEDYIELNFDNLQIIDDSGILKQKTAPQEKVKQKSQEEINKEILTNPNASEIAPRLFVSSLGFKDWENYKKQFCCPTYKQDPKEHVKCNQNISKSFKDGWRPGDEIPEGMKSSYCEENDLTSSETELGIDGSGKGAEGEGTGAPVKVGDEGEKGMINQKSVPYYIDVKPENVYDPKWIEEGTFDEWFSDNFNPPKKIEDDYEVSFVINSNGTTSDYQILTSSGNKKVDDYTIEFLKSMPKWEPGKTNDSPTNTKITIPIQKSE